MSNAKIDSVQCRKKQWLVILIILLSPLFFVGGPDYYSPRSYKNFWNLGHVVYFALFSYLLMIDGRLFRKKSFFQGLFSCLFIAAILGLAIELAQSGFDRDVDYNDLWRDILGASFGFFLSPQSLNELTKFFIFLSLTVFLSLQSVPWFQMLADEIRAKEQFPILSDFETSGEITRWSGDATISVSDEIAFSGRHSLRVDLGTNKYSGIELRYFPSDWSGYQALIFEVFNPDNKLEITVRIHDKLHIQGEQLYSDRFNRALILRKGWNTIRIDLENVANAPATRRMDLSAVSALGVFVIEQPVPKRIYVDSVRLVYYEDDQNQGASPDCCRKGECEISSRNNLRATTKGDDRNELRRIIYIM